MTLIASFFSVAGPKPWLSPMQPNPSADTSNPLFPRVRFFTFYLQACMSLIACVLWPSHTKEQAVDVVKISRLEKRCPSERAEARARFDRRTVRALDGH